MQLRGEIEIFARNVDTLEIEGHYKKSNIIVDFAFINLIASARDFNLPGGIAVTTQRMSPSRIKNTIPGGAPGITSWGNPIPNVTSPNYFPAAGATPAFTEWGTRIPVPPSNRQINTIMLTDGNISMQASIDTINALPTFANIHAYSKLSTPCSQSTSQILDVYYRVQFPAQTQYSKSTYDIIAQRISGVYGGLNNGILYFHTSSSPFRLPALKPADVPNVSYSSYFFNNVISSKSGLPAAYAAVQSFFKIKYNVALALTDFDGAMIGSINQVNFGQELVTAVAPYVTPKIQNVFGHTPSTTLQFLDVDALPSGTGAFIPAGSWTNKNTPVNAGQYYGGAFSKMFYVNVNAGGAVGVATYTYGKRHCFGFEPAISSTAQAVTPVHALCTLMPQTNFDFPTTNNPGFNTGLLGDLTQFGARQLTSTVAYDAVSVVIPSANRVLLYNLANSDYWTYTGGFTNLTQVAVAGGKIYASCATTGLWVIDPVVGSVTSITAPAVGVDLSHTYGVAAGFNGALWVVGANCIAKFDGTSAWTPYNQTTTPAFNVVGISDGNWSNIEYLKCNASNANGELLLVRKLNATVDAANFGCWWSLAGVASDTSVDPMSTGTHGQIRVNRSHINCSPHDGTWVVHWNNTIEALTFGTATVTPLPGAPDLYSLEPARQVITDALNSVNFVTGPAGGDKVLQIGASHITQPVTYARAQIYLTNTDGSGLAASLTDASPKPPSMVLSSDQFSNQMYISTSTDYVGYGYRDNSVCVNLGNGVLFSMANIQTFGSILGNYANGIYAALYVFPFDTSISAAGGGALAYLGQTNYGWNGSSWVAGNNTPKATHSTAQALDEGLTLQFVDGTSGASFVASEFYNFAVCEGTLKDNATTNTLEDNFYYKKAYVNSTDISAGTIPVPIAGSTGLVGIDMTRSNSTDTSLDGSNNTVFLDQNGSQFSVGDKVVIGDFNISYAYDHNNANMADVFFGIGIAGLGVIQYGYFVLPEQGNMYISYLLPDGTRTFQIVGPPSGITSLAISRTGSTIQFIVNGTPMTLNQGILSPGLGKTRYNLICTPVDLWQPSLSVANRTAPAATITANGSDNALLVGTMVNSTGYFNPAFLGIDTDARGAISAMIGGTPAINIHVDGTAPALGEVTVDPFMGTFVFNAGDQGKTFSMSCTYLTHE